MKYELYDLRDERKFMGCEWTLKGKYKIYGFIDKFKALLIVKSFTQK